VKLTPSQTYYWTTIRKNRSAYHPCRGVREEDVTSIIQKSVIVEKDAAKAESQLLALPGLKKYSDSLKTEKEKDDFRRHLRRYVNIYLPECPFEVASTNRYTVVTHEAAVTARRFIKKGEVVKYLCGIQVIMTEEEEDHIKHSRRDFSIVISSRNRAASLFLGPARFANHDCGANARLQTTGSAGMEIYAIRNIEVGDEITVTYGMFTLPFSAKMVLTWSIGENYFGEDNCECLCKTCEDLCQNGWTADENTDTNAVPKLSIEEPADGYSLRRRRRLESSDESRDQSETPDVIIRPKVVKRTPRSLSRFKNAEESPAGKSPSVEPRQSPTKRKRDTELLSPSPGESVTKKAKKAPIVKEEETEVVFEAPLTNPSPASSSSESRRASEAPSSNNEATGTDATSVDEDTIIVQPLISPVISKLRRTRGAKLPDPLEQAKAGATILVSPSTTTSHPLLADDANSILSSLASDQELDESSMTVSRKNKRKRKLPPPKTDVDHAPPVRVPRDYVLTPALLAEPASSWIVCKICEEAFVQQNAYFTRSSCPRCERHSKLYGYMWPKTDKEGRDDKEERVLDHRTVHRFIRPEEERSIRKRDRGSTDSRDLTREESEIVVDKEEGRRSKRAKRFTI
jgi:histone-lysine N-methyltransferase SUV420H